MQKTVLLTLIRWHVNDVIYFFWFKEALEETKKQNTALQLSAKSQQNDFLDTQEAYKQERKSHEKEISRLHTKIEKLDAQLQKMEHELKQQQHTSKVEREKLEGEKTEQEASFKVMQQNQKITNDCRCFWTYNPIWF